MRGPILTGFGNLPSLTPCHQLDRLTGIPLGERGLVVVDSNEHALRVANEPVETGVDGPSFRRRTILVFDL
jgi:hypothetical protein